MSAEPDRRIRNNRTASLLERAGFPPSGLSEKNIQMGLDIRLVRISNKETIERWAQVTGIDPSVLRRIESGKSRMSGRVELIAMGLLVGHPEDFDGVLINNGMLPRLPEPLDEITRNNPLHQKLFAAAIKELMGIEGRQGAIERWFSVVDTKPTL